MEGTNVDSDLKWSNVEFQLPKSERPFLAFMAFDTLESVYSDKVLEAMSGVFGSIRRAKDVFVGFTTPQSASAAKLENLARVVLHLETINGSVVLYGSKPYTGLFSLSWDLCYRKIHELEQAGFLNVAEIVTTPKGKTMKLYRSLLKSAQLVYQDGIFKVKFEFDGEKDISGKWIELNAALDT